MTQSAVDYLKAEIKRRKDEGQALIDKAEEEGRSLAPEEVEKVEALVKEANGFKTRVEQMESQHKLRESIDQMVGANNEPAEQTPEGSKTMGDAFVKSDAYRALRNGGIQGGTWTTGPVDVGQLEGKATVTQTASPIAEENRQPGVQTINQRRLTIADLLLSGTTDGPVQYVQETTATNAAAAVAEGDLKPESTLIYSEVNEPIRKVATFLPVSDEMLEDQGQIRSVIDGRLRLFIQLEEERQLLLGSGVAPNVEGIMNRTGIQTLAKGVGGDIADALFTAITNIRVNGLEEPDGIVMHPTNWATVRTAKDANGQYYGGGPFTGSYGVGGLAPNNIWGLPVVVTPLMTLNTALVGAFGSQAQLFRKSGITVEASNSHTDFFQRNLTAIRAESRLALAVYRPAAFHSVTALNA